MSMLLWAVLPYVTIALLVAGTLWRYRHDRFGWTSRSSQLYEHRLLRIGGPLFHFGILVVAAGHLIGLAVPAAWTDAIGISEDAYHMQAILLGGTAGLATLVGAGILVYRRATTSAVRRATTRNDVTMYVVLLAAIVTGMAITAMNTGVAGHEHTYRETVSVWFRSIFTLQPDIDAMAAAPLSFQLHTLIGLVLFALWPFTRLVHAFTAPVHYLARPYLVYRTRDTGRPPHQSWDRLPTDDHAT